DVHAALAAGAADFVVVDSRSTASWDQGHVPGLLAPPRPAAERRQVRSGTRQGAGPRGSANHDPRVHAHPERLDLSRTPKPHLSFGTGIHYRMGAPLARLEAGIALGHLLTRTRHLEAATGTPRHKNITAAIRCLHALPVTPPLSR
ncbi:hypothetical protein ACWC2C_25425, partial [Streptomyces klenkii]